MRKKDIFEFQRICNTLESFSKNNNVPGLEDPAAIESLAMQMIESQRRIGFVEAVGSRPISPLRADPNSDLFDPVRAAVLLRQDGQVDEASWLVFLSVHFGHHLKDHWRLVKDVYGGLGSALWTWQRIASGVPLFRSWLEQHEAILRGEDGKKRRFGNHRKYTSLDAWKPNATGDAIATYVTWVNSAGGHKSLFNSALVSAEWDGKLAFAKLYEAMKVVASFGRIGRFDYLTMIGKTGIASITPDSPYFIGATGPLSGTKLLFGGGKSTKAYENLTIALGSQLNLNMQVMEDSICNWQKSPLSFKPFRG
ncbi:hypothetical protein [Pseudoxanthomonas winnipegensis]|uniref:alpha-glutamyl/putrescinyl thymine pyrophosphorylase clade 3 protein n=1 Tax=Pseudoxanthomonas winnipegensis TaxID=2480810 RepID=UPI00102DA813|nr:hypothetical protein [Pseudoxanthomonas winnipegensis]RZZ88147.1 hypothetical protein EA663_04645 [Pseudoxanthomonas winnipegensis]